MKRCTILTAFVIFAAMLAACGGQGLEEPAPTAAPEATSTPEVPATARPTAAETVATTEPIPTDTPFPGATPTPTVAVVAVATPTVPPPAPTSTPVLTPAPVVTPTPSPTSMPTPTLIPTPTPLPSTSLSVTRPSVLDYVDRAPPIASLITIGTPGADGSTTVTGAPGAVPASVLVMVSTLDYAKAEIVQAGSNGSFSASVIAAPGATIQVRYDPYDQGIGDPEMPVHQKNPWPGSLIRVPDDLSGTPGTPFSSAGSSGASSGTVMWAAQGTVADRNVQAEDQVSHIGHVTNIHSRRSDGARLAEPAATCRDCSSL